MTSGIYCIENVENGKQYIGKSKNLEKRMWDNHRDCLIVERAIKKYGDAIIRYVVEYCEPKKDILSYWEKYYIKEWDTKEPNGYNLTDGGDGGGTNPSEESRRRASESRMGNKNPNYGVEKTDDIKKRIGDSQRGEKSIHYKQYGKENPMFGIKHKNSTSIYHGVSIAHKNRKIIKWVVSFWYKSIKIWVGTFKTEIEAARAYDDYVIKHNLDRPLNFST